MNFLEFLEVFGVKGCERKEAQFSPQFDDMKGTERISAVGLSDYSWNQCVFWCDTGSVLSVQTG